MIPARRSEKIQSLIGRPDTLPSVPALYIELLEELKKPQTTFKSVAAIISRDVGMTAKILQLVNSAFFGFYRNISSVEQAVGILGLRMIRSLVLSVNIFKQFSSAKVSTFGIEGIMQHSVHTGALGRIIAKAQCAKDVALAEDAFMAGLLHDAGKLILADRATEPYAAVFAEAAGMNRPLVEVELEFLGATHADAGAYLLSNWKLPDNIVLATGWHHDPSAFPVAQFGPLSVVHVANAFEHRDNVQEVVRNLDMTYMEALHLTDRLDKWSEICHVLTRGEKRESAAV